MTSKTTTPSRLTPVTVLGMGPMGQAMATSFLAAGHPVTVWNRTPGRAVGVVAAGGQEAGSPADAVARSELILLSLTDYDAMWEVLEGAVGILAGRTLVNLSSDTPDKTREAAAWAAKHGAAFVTGGVMVPAAMVGTEVSYIYFSGDESAFAAHRATLARMGDPRFLGEDPGRAQLMYQANLDVFLTALTGVAHGIALVGTAGINAQTFLIEAVELLRAIPEMIAPSGVEALGADIDAGNHPGEDSSNVMMGATADHIWSTSRSVGVDTTLPGVVRHLYSRVIDEGFGSEGWTRIVDAIRDPSEDRRAGSCR